MSAIINFEKIVVPHQLQKFNKKKGNFQMENDKNRRFRELLNRPGVLFAAGTYDCVSARIAEKCGFDAVYMSGNGITASLLGKPDIGLTSMSEMVLRGHQIASCIDVPLLCDSDTGYGNINNVYRTVQEYEAAGVSAIHLEDQITPKKCGAMEGLALIPAEEMVEKIQVALSARKDPNFTIIARSDSAAVLGVDESIRRLKMYAAAGADVVFPEMIMTKEDILKVTTSVDAPVMFDILEQPPHQIFSVKELEGLGIKIVFNCLSAMFFVCNQLTQFYGDLKANGGYTGDYMNRMMPLHDYEALMGLVEQNSLRERVCKK